MGFLMPWIQLKIPKICFRKKFGKTVAQGTTAVTSKSMGLAMRLTDQLIRGVTGLRASHQPSLWLASNDYIILDCLDLLWLGFVNRRMHYGKHEWLQLPQIWEQEVGSWHLCWMATHILVADIRGIDWWWKGLLAAKLNTTWSAGGKHRLWPDQSWKHM